MTTKLSERLRAAMVRRKLSHKQAAHLAGVSDKTIQRILSGDEPSPKTLGRILEVIGDHAPAPASGPSVLNASLAILPFDALGPGAGLQMTADGLVEELLTSLAQFSELRVIARNSSFAFRGQHLDIPAIAKALNVRYVLEGSLRGDQTHFRIVVQLIDSTTGAHVWAGRYDRTGANILQLQDAVTEEIVRCIVPSLWRQEIGRIQRTPPESLDSWGLTVRAWTSYIAAMTPAAAHAGVALMAEVLEREPHYGFAHVVMSNLQAELGAVPLTPEAIAARAAAEHHGAEALRLCEHDPLVLLGCGYTKIRFGQAGDALPLLDRAAKLCPSHAYIRCYRGLALLLTGQLEEGLADLNLAEELSPVDAIMHRMLAYRGAALFELDREDESKRDMTKALTLNPTSLVALALQAGILAARGDMAAAAAHAARATEVSSIPFVFVVHGLRIAQSQYGLLRRIDAGWAQLETAMAAKT